MRVLVLTFYYPPDLCAGSFRAKAIVSALAAKAPSGTQIDVLTTLPNRYHSYSQEAAEIEAAPGIEIRRIALPAHRSDMTGQARAFNRFARQALRLTAGRKYDLVFATSSRLMTAALGALIARRKHAPLYLDVRDIFADTIGDILPAPLGWPARRLFSVIEHWTVRAADRTNLVSRGFEEYFTKRYGDRPRAWFTNGIDDEFVVLADRAGEPRSAESEATILYAGNIGEGQALHEIVPGLARALAGRARLVMIGDGGRRAQLEAAVAGIDNVRLYEPMPRPQLVEAYRRADVLFLHLGAHAAFEKVLPSKLFEYAALGKPVLAGVAGYAARFVTEEIDNAAVFPPGDTAAAVAALESLELVTRPRPQFVAKYARSRIAHAMADDVLALLPPPKC